MKKTFRLYNNSNASFFDLIHGDKETQQTKGLALLLSKSDLALKSFFEIERIKSKTGIIDWSKINQTIINAELSPKQNNQFRIDIVIRLYSSNRPIKIILIEAKSANKNITAKSAADQLEKYIFSGVYDELNEFDTANIHGVTLTKYPGYLKQENFASISWSDIINKFYYLNINDDYLLNDYFNFLTNIKGTMKFYEREVFSIPTAEWSNEAIKNYHIYECPNSGKYVIKHKPLYLTFRKSGGGEMEKLYKVENIIIITFSEEYKEFMEDETYSTQTRNNVKKYVEYMQIKGIWGADLPNDEKQVFILSDKTINLAHCPKPKRNNSFRAYYELSDLLNSENKIVETK